MHKGISTLLSNAGLPLSDRDPVLSDSLRGLAGALADDLLSMLREKNGFYAMESALHVFPSHSKQQNIGLDEWNDPGTWRNQYKGMADGCLFFAEDVFGSQFCIKDNKVCTFDPETGVCSYLARDINEWARMILSDYPLLTGYPLAHQWQEQYGQISAGKRLLPKIPFVAGGKFVLDNLYLGDAVEGMKFRAEIANQIKNLPDGAKIKLKVVS